MPSYSLLPGQYVRPSPPFKSQPRSHKEREPAGLAIITASIPPRPGPPPNRPLPPQPGTAGSAPTRSLYEIDESAHPLSARYANRDAHDTVDSVVNFFEGLLHEPAAHKGAARSPSLRPTPSSPTLRRRHLPKIRTRPLTPKCEGQECSRAQKLPIDARSPALPPSGTLARRASFGSGPTLDLSSPRPSQAPNGSGMRILKRSDNKPRPIREAPTDLSFLPVVLVDLSLYLEDHAGGLGEGCPIPSPATAQEPLHAERSATPTSTGNSAVGLRRLRRKGGYSQLRVREV